MNKIRIGGTWKDISVPSARVNGSWRPCKQIWVKVDGVWKISFDMTEPDPFDGSGSLQKTPGNVPWQQLSGTWTLESGVVTSSDSSNRVAAIDAGTPDITINIDASDVNKAGEGVAFWIEDQLNWWGLKTFYNYFSFSVPNNSFYNHFCNVNVENQTLNNSTKLAAIGWSSNVSFSTTGYNYISRSYLQRTCSCTNGTVTVGQSQNATDCVSSCTGNNFPACGFANCGVQSKFNCGGGCASGSCPSSYGNTFQVNSFHTCEQNVACPTSGGATTNFSSGAANCSQYLYVTYSCGYQTCASCAYSPSYSFSSRYFSAQTGNKNCTGSSGTTTVYSYSCSPESVQLPPSTSFVYQTQLQLVRSQSGSVNVIDSQSYGNMGNVYASTSGNSITARAYSSTGQAGTLYGPWTYDAGNVNKGTKHGILMSSVPYQQTFSISRFKADL